MAPPEYNFTNAVRGAVSSFCVSHAQQSGTTKSPGPEQDRKSSPKWEESR